MPRRGSPILLSAVVGLICATSLSAQPATTRSASDIRRESIAQLQQAIDEEYSHRDLRGVDWNALFAEWTPKLQQTDSVRAFAIAAAQMLSAAKDVQIWLRVEDERFSTGPAQADPNYNFARLAKLVPNWRDHGGLLYTGKFPDGIGYILPTTFEPDRLTSLEPAIQVLRDPQVKSLIIDVRMTFAGDEAMAKQLAGCFVDSPRLYAKHTVRQGGQTLGPFDRMLEPNKSAPAFRGRIAILAGPQCMDAGEDFLLMMKSARATLFGGKSFGSSSNPRPIRLSNGVSVYLPSWQDLRPDGSTFEGEGIPPGQEIRTKPGDFTTNDPVLDAALLFLRSRSSR